MRSADRWATFDCYGTLIDWNGGIGRELERLFGAEPLAQLLHAYHEAEPQVQCEDPTRSYRDVLALTLVRLAEPRLQRIVEQTGESAYLAIRGPGDTAVYIAMVEFPLIVWPAKVSVSVGPRPRTCAPVATPIEVSPPAASGSDVVRPP